LLATLHHLLATHHWLVVDHLTLHVHVSLHWHSLHIATHVSLHLVHVVHVSLLHSHVSLLHSHVVDWHTLGHSWLSSHGVVTICLIVKVSTSLHTGHPSTFGMVGTTTSSTDTETAANDAADQHTSGGGGSTFGLSGTGWAVSRVSAEAATATGAERFLNFARLASNVVKVRTTGIILDPSIVVVVSEVSVLATGEVAPSR